VNVSNKIQYTLGANSDYLPKQLFTHTLCTQPTKESG